MQDFWWSIPQISRQIFLCLNVCDKPRKIRIVLSNTVKHFHKLWNTEGWLCAKIAITMLLSVHINLFLNFVFTYFKPPSHPELIYGFQNSEGAAKSVQGNSHFCPCWNLPPFPSPTVNKGPGFEPVHWTVYWSRKIKWFRCPQVSKPMGKTYLIPMVKVSPTGYPDSRDWL